MLCRGGGTFEMETIPMQVLLLPGMDGTGELFAPLLQSLPSHLHPKVIRYPLDQAWGYEELLSLVEASAPTEPFIVLGESFSGPLAISLAAKRPPKLQGVILCASFIKFPLRVPKKWRSFLRPWMFRFQPLWPLSFFLLGRHAFGDLGRMLRKSVKSVSPEAFAARAKGVAVVDVTSELQNCSVPVLYLQAANDLVIHRSCWELIRSVRPDAQMKLISGPHLVLQVSPSVAASHLSEFCIQVEKSRS
jgi:pimeloyl-ACP methyl ester carboxylesterase